MSELHIHLSPGVPEVLHLYLHGDNVVVHQDDTNPGGGEGPAVEAMLKRFEAYNAKTRARKLADELRTLGYSPAISTPRKSPRPGSYIHWTCVGAIRKVVLYNDSANLSSGGKPDRALATTLPGGEVSDRLVRWPINTAEGFKAAVDAAKALRDAA